MVSSGLNRDERKSDIAFLTGGDWQWLAGKIIKTARSANRWGIDASQIQNTVQYTTYGPGDHFVMHDDNADSDPNDHRSLSISVLLQDADEGGAFVIEGHGPVEMKPGEAIVFPAKQRHMVEPIIRGRRESLVLWLSRRTE